MEVVSCFDLVFFWLHEQGVDLLELGELGLLVELPLFLFVVEAKIVWLGCEFAWLFEDLFGLVGNLWLWELF